MISKRCWRGDFPTRSALFVRSRRRFPCPGLAHASDSHITAITRYTTAGQEFHGRPPGSVMTVAYEIIGFGLTALNGGLHFAPSPSLSPFFPLEAVPQPAFGYTWT